MQYFVTLQLHYTLLQYATLCYITITLQKVTESYTLLHYNYITKSYVMQQKVTLQLHYKKQHFVTKHYNIKYLQTLAMLYFCNATCLQAFANCC